MKLKINPQFKRLFWYAFHTDLKYMPLIAITWFPVIGLLFMALMMQEYIFRRARFYQILGVEQAMQVVWAVWIAYQAVSLIGAAIYFAVLGN